MSNGYTVKNTTLISNEVLQQLMLPSEKKKRQLEKERKRPLSQDLMTKQEANKHIARNDYYKKMKHLKYQHREVEANNILVMLDAMYQIED